MFIDTIEWSLNVSTSVRLLDIGSTLYSDVESVVINGGYTTHLSMIKTESIT